MPGWDLNCAVAGSILAELSLLGRIDTDLESLFLVDATETGDPVLDPFLEAIADDQVRRDAQYWIERPAPRTEEVIDLILDRMVVRKIPKHHDGDYWTLASTAFGTEVFSHSTADTVGQFIKTRIGRVVYTDEIPLPRDIIIISLVNTCGVLRYIYPLDKEAEERIELICQMDLIGRSIAAAVALHLRGPIPKRSALTKKIPAVPLRQLLLNPHLRSGNLPALFADLAKRHGPVFELRPPFSRRMIFLAGTEVNRWAHSRGRMYLRTRDYFSDFEKVYGASGVLPSLDGADHFRLRKAMSESHSRSRLSQQIGPLCDHIRGYMAGWKVGDRWPARGCRLMINAQISPLSLSVDSQDLIEALVAYKERALVTHIMKGLPKFMLKTPGMRRRAKVVDVLLERVQSVHTPSQRAGCPRELADDWLSLHASDPQLVPQSNLRFALSAALIASVYLGDMLAFTVYAMASQPELQRRLRSEADELFANGDPEGDRLGPQSYDVTQRFILECMRMYPIVPMSMRTVMNFCAVEGYEIPVGETIFIAQTAPHYMEDVFPDPFTFDIDRYLPPRDEHRSPGYAPRGLGTHRCLGARWFEMQLAVNIMLIARHFRLEVPPGYKLKCSPIPSMKPSKKLKFHIAEQVRELPV